jgi:hypothetical protein
VQKAITRGVDPIAPPLPPVPPLLSLPPLCVSSIDAPGWDARLEPVFTYWAVPAVPVTVTESENPPLL